MTSVFLKSSGELTVRPLLFEFQVGTRGPSTFIRVSSGEPAVRPLSHELDQWFQVQLVVAQESCSLSAEWGTHGPSIRLKGSAITKCNAWSLVK